MNVNPHFLMKWNAAFALPWAGPKSSCQLLPSAIFQRWPICLTTIVFGLKGMASRECPFLEYPITCWACFLARQATIWPPDYRG
jgi:hypothetical protein